MPKNKDKSLFIAEIPYPAKAEALLYAACTVLILIIWAIRLTVNGKLDTQEHFGCILVMSLTALASLYYGCIKRKPIVEMINMNSFVVRLFKKSKRLYTIYKIYSFTVWFILLLLVISIVSVKGWPTNEVIFNTLCHWWPCLLMAVIMKEIKPCMAAFTNLKIDNLFKDEPDNNAEV